MPYATLEQLCSQYGFTEIAELLSDENQLLTTQMLEDAVKGADLTSYSAEEQADIADAVARANDALTQQSIFMDSKIATRYKLPLTSQAIAAAPLNECCLAMTRAFLSDDADNFSQMIEGARTRWIKWLSDLAKDASVIPNAEKIATGGTQKNYLTGKPKGLDLTEY